MNNFVEPEDTVKNIFISYSSRNEEDVRIAGFIYRSLRDINQNVFYSEATIDIGKKWADQVEHALNICDYFILILSQESILSDMVLEEVRRAKKRKDKEKKPEIIPIRVRMPMSLELPYALATYIQSIQHFFWKEEANNENLINFLKRTIKESSVNQVKRKPAQEENLTLRQKIHFFIGNNQTEDALILLAASSEDTVLLQAQYKDAKDKFHLGSIDFGEWQRVQARVNLGALEIMSETSVQPTNSISSHSVKLENTIETIEPKFPLSSADLWVNDRTVNRNYYIERSVDEKCRQVIFRPHSPYSILLIKAPRQYGKTTLLSHLILEAEKLKYATVIIDFQLFPEADLGDLERLLKLICATASEQLRLPERVNEYWAALYRSQLDKITQYFNEYLLKDHQKPILFAIDKADKLFKYRDNTTDFFGMLRSWYETFKNTNDPTWKNFSMIITYSTEDIPIEDINRSPFHVGEVVELHEFDAEQVLDLAKAHTLNWRIETAKTLQTLLGGHPYLVKRALYEISENNYTLDSFLAEAQSDDGPFGDHLKRIFFKLSLDKHQRRLDTLKDILTTGTSGNHQECLYLKALGLIKSTPDGYALRSELYRNYFQHKLIPSRSRSFLNRLVNFFK